MITKQISVITVFLIVNMFGSNSTTGFYFFQIKLLSTLVKFKMGLTDRSGGCKAVGIENNRSKNDLLHL